MADMELVIKIPERVKKLFDDAKNEDLHGSYYDYNSLIGKAIKNGTPLPKGHGRLIDADVLKPYDCDYDNGYGCDKICYCDNCTHQSVKASKIDNAPTIIEADKEGE